MPLGEDEPSCWYLDTSGRQGMYVGGCHPGKGHLVPTLQVSKWESGGGGTQ